jgi:hypothetical protein
MLSESTVDIDMCSVGHFAIQDGLSDLVMFTC